MPTASAKGDCVEHVLSHSSDAEACTWRLMRDFQNFCYDDPGHLAAST